MKRASIVFLASLLSILPAFPQTSERDKTEAVRTAHLFTQRLRKTQDIEALLVEFFNRDFVNKAGRDRGFNWFSLLKKDLKLTRVQSRRYYLATQNWIYLTWLYNCKESPGTFGTDDFRITGPLEVTKIMERDSRFRYLLHSDDESDKEGIFLDSPAGVLKMTKDAERMNSVYRRYLIGIRAISNTRFVRLVEKCELPDKPFFHVETVKCDGFADCHDLSRTAELIGVRVPGFDYVDFARINGRIRIIRLFDWEENLD
jgi:hypothetical protein